MRSRHKPLVYSWPTYRPWEKYLKCFKQSNKKCSTFWYCVINELEISHSLEYGTWSDWPCLWKTLSLPSLIVKIRPVLQIRDFCCWVDLACQPAVAALLSSQQCACIIAGFSVALQPCGSSAEYIRQHLKSCNYLHRRKSIDKQACPQDFRTYLRLKGLEEEEPFST